MKVMLIFPPQFNPCQPYLSLPALSAFLRANEIELVQKDVNIEFYDLILSKLELERAYVRLKRKYEQSKAKNKNIKKMIKCGLLIIDNIEEAKQDLRNQEGFFKPETFIIANKIIQMAMQLISLAYNDDVGTFSFDFYLMPYSGDNTNDIVKAVSDDNINIFIEFYKQYTIPDILSFSPEVIGISIASTSQLIPALTLANLIKSADIKAHVTIGGNVVTRLKEALLQNTTLFSFFDSAIIFEGEHALLELIKRIENQESFYGVPNLIYLDGASIRLNKERYIEDTKLLPTPDFDGLPLKLYFSPQPNLPLQLARGCHWHRCAFCDSFVGYPGTYRLRSMQQIIEDIRLLARDYNTNTFTFVDETIPAAVLDSLSTKILESNLNISWNTCTRFDKAFTLDLCRKMKRAGCKMLMFGLESGSNRVLKAMEKGINTEIVKEVLQNTNLSRIWTHLFVFFGFPSETVEEAEETIRFILKNSRIINTVSRGVVFNLLKHSKIYKNPNLYYIEKIIDDEKDLALSYDYQVHHGITNSEARDISSRFDKIALERLPYEFLVKFFGLEDIFQYLAHFGNDMSWFSEIEKICILQFAIKICWLRQ